jgi:DNA-binding CsgD family transcriptional regulator
MESTAPVQVMQGFGSPADSAATYGPHWAALMDEVAHGIVVVDFQGRVIQANRAARHQMEHSGFVRCRQGQFEFALPESDAELRRALVAAAQCKRSLIEFQAAQGPALAVAVLPLRSSPIAEPTHAALFFARTSISDSATLSLFARNYRLTPAEEDVLGVLCQGLSAPQIASVLKVAVSTVRSHIRSVCAKTQCKSVRELVTRIANLPPVGPSLGRAPVH